MLNLSEATIYMRIKRLKENGVIKGFFTDIDFDKIGLSVVAFVMIKAEPKQYEKVIEELIKQKEIFLKYMTLQESFTLSSRLESRPEKSWLRSWIS